MECISDVEAERLVLARIDTHLSWAAWESSRRQLKLPVHLKRMQRLQQSLLASLVPQSLPLHSGRGAFFPLLEFLPRVIGYELQLGRLPNPLPPLSLKVSFDGRRLRDHSNIVWLASFIESTDVQSPDAQYTFALVDMREPELAGSPVWTEMDLDAAIAHLRAYTLPIGNQEVDIQPLLCADWKAASYVGGFAPPNAGPEALICGWCSIDKAALQLFHLQERLFERMPVDLLRTVRELPSLPVWRFRYDPMHATNRLLDNYLRLLQCLSHDREIKQILRRICDTWGDDGALCPQETRKFFQNLMDDEVVDLFIADQHQLQLQRPDAAPEAVTVHEIARRTMRACRTYWEFTRLRDTSDAQIAQLVQARNHLLAASHALHVPLAPPRTI